jgi:hypothetical protein
MFISERQALLFKRKQFAVLCTYLLRGSPAANSAECTRWDGVAP